MSRIVPYRQRRSTLAILASLLILLSVRLPARAQDNGPEVVQNEALVDFPETVTFRLELAPGIAVREATLTYQLGRQSCLPAGTHVPVEPGGSTLEWTWVMSRSGNPPPGAEMWWEWTVTDTEGNTLTTPRQQLTFEDSRFDWQTVEAGEPGQPARIRLHWYRGDEVGPVLLEAAVTALERLEQEMGIDLQGQVQFYIYGDSADMRQALLYVQDWAGGVAFGDYNTILIGVTPSQANTWGRSTVKHELAHLVVDQFARSCLGGSRPTWLNEGLAVYAEGEPDASVLSDIKRGIEEDAFQPVRSLNGPFPTRGGEASMAYSQSYSLVAHLLDNYGPEKMQQLLLTLADATAYDAALEQVYGFNVDGLEVAWRAAIGAPPRQIPATPTPIVAALIPTVEPLGAARSMPTPGPASTSAPEAPPPELSPPAEEGPVSGPSPTTQEGAAPATAAPEQTSSTGGSSGLCGLGLVPLVVGFGLAAVVARRNLDKRPRKK